MAAPKTSKVNHFGEGCNGSLLLVDASEVTRHVIQDLRIASGQRFTDFYHAETFLGVSFDIGA